jgi:mevalonate kinase
VTMAYAPGKVILVGEHAVVYGRPAVALPVTQVRAEARVERAREGQGIVIEATDLGQTLVLGRGEPAGPLRALQVAVTGVLLHLGLSLAQDLTVTVRSSIPIARGLGSGAAVSTAVTRAVARHFSTELTPAEVSRLVYEVERIHHGTPSGIDNTVIAYERPVYFVRGEEPEPLAVGQALSLLVADTGLANPTKEVVDAVRQAWQRSRERYDDLFDQIGSIAVEVRRAIESGAVAQVGRMMDENHGLLQAMDVSSPHLDSLVAAARKAGALGAKLSGAGRGGNVIALVSSQTRETVQRALVSEGAQRVIRTEILPSREQASWVTPSLGESGAAEP